jgi:hypothetical protein
MILTACFLLSGYLFFIIQSDSVIKMHMGHTKHVDRAWVTILGLADMVPFLLMSLIQKH